MNSFFSKGSKQALATSGFGIAWITITANLYTVHQENVEISSSRKNSGQFRTEHEKKSGYANSWLH